MTYKIIGLSDESGEPVEVYIVGVESAAEAVDVARSYGVKASKVAAIFNAFVPPGARVIRVKGPNDRVTGEKGSLEAIANCALVQRPIRTLAVAMILASLITGAIWFVIVAAVSNH